MQEISVKHTKGLFGGNFGILFYDVTTLYFETTNKDELRESGSSKDGKMQIHKLFWEFLCNRREYPLSYSLFNGSQHEGYTMLPIVDDFVQRFNLGKDFVVIANSGLMSTKNLKLLRDGGYKYINRCQNKEGTLTKVDINKRGYNKFLSVSFGITVSIDEEKIKEDVIWDGLKGYKTNTGLSPEKVYEAYQNLWNVQQSFRITKGTLDVRPMFHFTPRRIKAHVYICFVALKVYKELKKAIKIVWVTILCR